MLSEKQLEEIKEHLEKAQNPLFFFDNDVDGLCSFLLLQRALGRGKGVAIRSFPGLNKQYLRKINELNPDYIFILDKPVVENEFLQGVFEKNLPIVWIDHHEIKIDKDILKKISYYNSFPSAEPVTYLCYKVFNRKEDMWFAMIGCIGDVYMPEFSDEFSKNFPDLFDAQRTAFSSLYTTKLGEAVAILNFGLKDTTTNIVRLIKFLIKSKGIYDIFEENLLTKQLHKKYKELKKIYDKLVEKAEKDIHNKLLIFSYSGKVSMSSEIANELYFKHKDKIILVIYKNQEKANISIRGKNAKNLTLKVIEGIECATGGGHEEACGAQVPIDKLENFVERFKKVEQLQK